MKKTILFLAISSIVASCNMGGGNDKAMEHHRAMRDMNKGCMQKFYDEVFNKHNPAMFDSVTNADFVEHQSAPGIPATRDGNKKLFAGLFAAFPDITDKVNFMIADTSFVVTQYTMTGTNSGAWWGMPPTGKQINIDGIDIVRFVNGKATDHWGNIDADKMYTQMGMTLIPASDTAKCNMSKSK